MAATFASRHRESETSPFSNARGSPRRTTCRAPVPSRATQADTTEAPVRIAMAAGAVAEGGESEAIQQAVGEAIQIAKLIDESVMADEEFD